MLRKLCVAATALALVAGGIVAVAGFTAPAAYAVVTKTPPPLFSPIKRVSSGCLAPDSKGAASKAAR